MKPLAITVERDPIRGEGAGGSTSTTVNATATTPSTTPGLATTRSPKPKPAGDRPALRRRNTGQPDVTLPVTNPRHWLSASESYTITHTPIPYVAEDFTSVEAKAAIDRNFREAYLLRHWLKLTDKPAAALTDAQRAFANRHQDPAWFVELTRVEAIGDRVTDSTEGASTSDQSSTTAGAATGATPPIGKCPAWDAPYEDWAAFYQANPGAHFRGISRLPSGDPHPSQLQGYCWLRPLLARPSTKAEESRAKRSAQFDAIVPIFVERSASGRIGYEDKLHELAVVPNETWAPTPFASADNLNVDDFVRFAATCGLTVERATGAVQAFCLSWLGEAEPSMTSMDVDRE
jgi:hypothetical protein